MSKRPIKPTQSDRERQALVMSQLRTRSGLELTPAAAAIGVSASTLSRYESGETIIPAAYYRAVGLAYDIPRATLARVLHDDGALPDWLGAQKFDLRAELHAVADPGDPLVIDTLAEFGDDDEHDQRIALEMVMLARRLDRDHAEHDADGPARRRAGNG